MKWILLIGFIWVGSCKDNATNIEEEEVDNTLPGKRNYTWSIDSIDYEGRYGEIAFASIWGSSPTDVYGAAYTADLRDCLWHYDGKVWKRVLAGTPLALVDGYKIVGRVWGTARNDVWAIGGREYNNGNVLAPFVMHYNGTTWIEVTGNTSQMPTGCTDINGAGKDDFWVSQYESVHHYKNGVWKKYFLESGLLVNRIAANNVITCLSAYIPGSRVNKLFQFKDNTFIVIDETSNDKFDISGLFIRRNNILTLGYGVSITNIRKDNTIDTSGWNKELQLPSLGFSKGYFQSSKNIIAVGYPKVIYHYNGTDWKPLEIQVDNHTVANDATFIGVWADSSEIFVCDTWRGIIYHGK